MVQVRTRDEAIQILEDLYREDGARLWRAILAYSRSSEIASDATSEAFAQAISRGPQIESPRRWIWTVAFRIARGQMKSNRYQEVVPVTPSMSEEGLRRVDLLNAIKLLTPKERAAILLHYYGDYPIKHVASIMGTSSGAVRVHMNRGRKKLRSILGGEYE